MKLLVTGAVAFIDFHTSQLLLGCLVPGFDGVVHENLPLQEVLWDNYSTAAPA
jgi:hypothetical protein